MTFPLNHNLSNLLHYIRDVGGKPIIVGGAVRDFLLDGREPKDVDIEVYGIDFELLERGLARWPTLKVDAVGKSFGVLKVTMGGQTMYSGEDFESEKHIPVETFDVSLPRRENKEGRGHKGFVATPDPNMSFGDAAARRDFTINSVGYDPQAQEFLDPFKGRKDLEDRVLRVISPHFSEDPLRVLRACQFAARFEMKIAVTCMDMCRKLIPELRTLPKERLWEEWKKLLLKAEKPSIGIEAMRQTGALLHLFIELESLVGVPQDPEWHPEGDVWTHNQMVVDEAAKIIRRDGLLESDPDEALIVMLGALCHDLGKPTTTEQIDGRWRSLSHDKAGVPLTESLLGKMGCPKSIAEQVLPLVERHLAPSTFFKQKVGNGAIRRLALKVPLQRLVRVAEADHMGRTTPGVLAGEAYQAGQWMLERASKLSVKNEGPRPLLLGRHLLAMGFDPGPEMGKMLKEAFEAQMDDAFVDENSAVKWAQRRWKCTTR